MLNGITAHNLQDPTARGKQRSEQQTLFIGLDKQIKTQTHKVPSGDYGPFCRRPGRSPTRKAQSGDLAVPGEGRRAGPGAQIPWLT